ncbi:MAG: integral rane sensor signal transduction histidine kinase, partial [Chthoniobacter sp.]|nr:integral rane sensor signal transduction histidine kinase [Chthoniobacter sp.]
MKGAGVSRSRDLRFRTKLLLGMMLVVLALTGLGLFLAQRKVSHEAAIDLQKDFRSTLATLSSVQEVRHAALAERCRALVRRPRIHAALEDDALDLLYPSSRDELRDVMGSEEEPVPGGPPTLRARFYRFLDSRGTVISPPLGAEVGDLTPLEETQLSLPRAPEAQQLGYLARETAGAIEEIDDVIAMPIVSTETGDVIAALVLGFKPVDLGGRRAGVEIRSGIQLGERLHLPALAPTARTTLAAEVSRAANSPTPAGESFPASINGEPHQIFFKRRNADSLYPPAHEVVVYPLAAARARQRQLGGHVLLAGAALLLLGLAASHFLTARLSAPVEKLEVDSAEDRIRRARAESVLEMTSAELQR